MAEFTHKKSVLISKNPSQIELFSLQHFQPHFTDGFWMLFVVESVSVLLRYICG